MQHGRLGLRILQEFLFLRGPFELDDQACSFEDVEEMRVISSLSSARSPAGTRDPLFGPGFPTVRPPSRRDPSGSSLRPQQILPAGPGRYPGENLRAAQIRTCGVQRSSTGGRTRRGAPSEWESRSAWNSITSLPQSTLPAVRRKRVVVFVQAMDERSTRDH